MSERQRAGYVGRFRETLRDLYHERTNFQIVRHARRWALLSAALILISVVSFATRSLNLGIDFTGGTAWEVTVEGDAPSTDSVRDTVAPFGIADAEISFREDRATGATTILVQAEELEAAPRDEVSAALEQFGEIAAVNEVGPSWGESVTEEAVRALVVFFVLIGLYLALRFEWRMSIAAMIAVVHDIVITVGVYSLTGSEVTPATVIAFLTILGFSLYDTVIVFDKVKENEATLGAERADTYSAMVNRSLNQVLARSLNTSLTAVLPVISIMVVGVYYLNAVALQEFALALLIGIVAGAYSSIFVATPLVAWLNERRPKHRALRDRSSRARPRARVGVTAGVADVGALAAAEREAVADRPDDFDEPEVVDDEVEHPTPSRPSRPDRPARGVTPRPRKQRRRKRR